MTVPCMYSESRTCCISTRRTARQTELPADEQTDAYDNCINMYMTAPMHVQCHSTDRIDDHVCMCVFVCRHVTRLIEHHRCTQGQHCCHACHTAITCIHLIGCRDATMHISLSCCVSTTNEVHRYDHATRLHLMSPCDALRCNTPHTLVRGFHCNIQHTLETL